MTSARTISSVVRLSIFSAAFSTIACSSSSNPSSGASNGEVSAKSGTTLYVTMYSENKLYVVDAETHAVKNQADIGQGPAILLETPDHSKLYTANWLDNSISALDAKTLGGTTISLDARPWVIAMAPDGKTLYSGVGTNEIAVIDTSTDTITRMIATPQLPESIIVSPDGKTLYVALFTDSTLEALAADTGEIVQQPIKMGSIPAWATISPDGAYVYALNFLSGDVSTVDTKTWEVSATTTLESGSDPITGSPTPDGSLLAVTNFGNGGVILIDTKTHQVASSLHIDGRTVGVAFSADGKRGYATDLGTASFAANPVDLVLNASFGSVTGQPGHVTVFEPTTGNIVDTITLGTGPTSIVAMSH